MFRKLFGRGRRQQHDPWPAPAARRGRWTPQCEVLEARTAPAVSVSLSDRVLDIVGDAATDTITIDHSGTNTSVTRSAPAPFTLTFPDATFDIIFINTGVGNDRVNIRRTVKRTDITSTGFPGNDVVNLGNATNGMQGITAPLTITNSTALTSINVTDAANTVGRTASHRFNAATGFATLSGLAPAAITYNASSLADLDIALGSGADTFNFDDTCGRATSLQTGAGNDTVYVQRTSRLLAVTSSGGIDRVNVGNPTSGVQSIRGTLTITNPASSTTLNVNDTGNTANRAARHTIDAGTGLATISGLAPGLLTYQTNDINGLNLTLGSGDDSFTFVNTDNAPTALQTGAGIDHVHVERTGGPLTVTNSGSDTVDVGNPTNGVQGITGTVTITNPSSSTTISVSDEADTVGRSATHSINAGTGFATLSGLAPAAITYHTAALNFLVISLGSGADTFTFANTDNAPTLLHSGLGDDTVSVERTGGPLTVDGGVGDDVFSLGPALATQMLRPAFQGDSGGDALDYSAYAASVSVNLRTGQATGTNGVSSIEYALGGSGNDILVGVGGNVFGGGPGRDILIGGASPSVLFGDFFEDQGEDILIAGTTAYDTNAIALTTIQILWSSGLSYEARVFGLLNGAGAPRLDATTVTSNGGPNLFLGGGGRDFLFLRPAVDIFIDPEDDEVVVPI